MTELAYMILTNNDLLYEITKWYILEHIDDHKKFIDIICKDKNIVKLVWLLDNNFITIDKINQITQQLTKKFTGIHNNLSFFDYAYYANSKNIIEYLSQNIDLTKLDLKTYVNNMFENEHLSTDAFKNFISFYNELPDNNLFDKIFTECDSPNIDILMDTLKTPVNHFGNFNLHIKEEVKYEDILFKFLIKSNLVTLEYLDNNLNYTDMDGIVLRKTIIYMISKNLHNSFDYLLYKYPNEKNNLINSGIFDDDAIHDYLFKNCFEVYNMLLQNKVNVRYDKSIDLLLRIILTKKKQFYANIYIGKRTMYVDVLINTLKKLNVYPQIINCIEKGEEKEIIKIHHYIKKNNLCLDNELLNSLILCYTDNLVEQFGLISIDMKNACVKYLQDKNDMQSLGKIILDKDINIEFNEKLNILLKNEMYINAFDTICLSKDKIKYVESFPSCTKYEKCINDVFNKCFISTNIQPLLNHIYLNEDDYDIVNFFNLLVKQIGLDDKLYIVNNLPKKLNKFYEIFNIICDSIIDIIDICVEYCENLYLAKISSCEKVIENYEHGLGRIYDIILDAGTGIEQAIKQLNDITSNKPNFVELCNNENLQNNNISNFVNEYNLSTQLDKFINSNNYLIQNVVIQNMLNKGLINDKITMKFKMITMTSNIYKKNIKNIDYVINNLVKNDHNMLVIMLNYAKRLPDCHKVSLNDLKIFLHHVQKSYINDDDIFNNFTLNEKIDNEMKLWFFEYFIMAGMPKCLDVFFTFNNDMKYNRTHIKMAKNSKVRDVLIKYKSSYTITNVKPIKL